jgi:hypothetical protein
MKNYIQGRKREKILSEKIESEQDGKTEGRQRNIKERVRRKKKESERKEESAEG